MDSPKIRFTGSISCTIFFYVLEAVAVNSTALYVVTWCSLVYIFADFSEERIDTMI